MIMITSSIFQTLLLTLIIGISFLPETTNAHMPYKNSYGKPCVEIVIYDDMSEWEQDNSCPRRMTCFVDRKPFFYNSSTGVETEYEEWQLPQNPNNQTYNYGYCDCNRFYGFAGPAEEGAECTDLTLGGRFFQVWTHLLIFGMSYFYYMVIYTIISFKGSDQFKQNASCYTLIHLTWTVPICIAFELGYA